MRVLLTNSRKAMNLIEYHELVAEYLRCGFFCIFFSVNKIEILVIFEIWSFKCLCKIHSCRVFSNDLDVITHLHCIINTVTLEIITVFVYYMRHVRKNTIFSEPLLCCLYFIINKQVAFFQEFSLGLRTYTLLHLIAIGTKPVYLGLGLYDLFV